LGSDKNPNHHPFKHNKASTRVVKKFLHLTAIIKSADLWLAHLPNRAKYLYKFCIPTLLTLWDGF